MTARRRRIVRVEDLIGRKVRLTTGEPVGRIEEIRAERRAHGEHDVVEYHLGSGALLERLALVRKIFGRKSHLLVARWDQVDIHDPEAPTLTCGVEELKHVDR
jgi:hypothetical protein